MKKLLSLLFLIMVQVGFAQTTIISGKVTNSLDGSPIAGANVLVQGTNKGATTNVEGKFNIEAAPSDVLTVTSVGFATQKINLKGSKTINISLTEQTKSLDDVVVIGSTNKVSRKELGNAITSVKSKDLLRSQPTSLTSALQGKVGGAQISQNSGDPSGGFSIKLRGTSSILGSSDPLYVIDGVVMNNASTNVTNLSVTGGNSNIRLGQNRSVDINPNDIESVEVLNGGAAAAIYGSRAANGVVLITTKKGKSGAPKFTFSNTTSINSLRKRLDTNLVGKQFVNNINVALFPINTASLTPTATTVNVLGRNLETRTFDVTRRDYQDDIFTTGLGNDTYFSATGGNETTKYSSSIGYLKNDGIVKNSDFKKLGLKLNLSHALNSKLTVSLGLNYINSGSNEKPDGNVFYSPLNSVTITNNIYNLSARDANGNLLVVDSGRVNPLSVIETFNITQETDRIVSDIQLNFKPFKNFNADFIVGLDNYSQKGNVFIPRFPYLPVNTFPTGYVSEVSNKVSQVNNDLNLRYLWEVTPDFKATTSAGYNLQSYKDKFFGLEGTDLKPFVETINAFNAITTGSPISSEAKYNIWGYYLQETLGYKDKLFLTAAARLDASTIFSKENRSQYYPKLSASYVLSNEDFMKDAFVSSARVRASWGESGSLTAIGPYSRFTNYSTGNLLGNTTFSIEGNKKGNLDLRPEKSRTYEVGADFGLLKDRINMSFSYYNADIIDLLLPVQSAASTGSTNTIKNIGKMNNKGYELGLKVNALRKNDVNLDLSFNYSTNKNVVTELPQPRFALDNNPAGAPVFVEVGKPIGIYYGTYYARNPDGSLLLTPTGYPQGEKGNAAGEPQRDAAGQPIGTFLNKEIGDPNPDYILSFGANLNVKKFGFSALFDGVKGGDIFDADYRTRQGVGSGELVAKELNGELPRGYIWSIYNIQEFRVVDGSYIKLREVALSYSFGKLLKQFDDITLTACGRNLYSWDNFPSYDPETNSGGQSSVAKYNFGTIPIPKTVSVAIKVQF